MMQTSVYYTKLCHKEGHRSELDADKETCLEVNVEIANYMFLSRHWDRRQL
jgi:hypothetical protein